MALSRKWLADIDDVFKMSEVMKVLDIPSKGTRTLDEMRDRVEDYLQASEQTAAWTAGQVIIIPRLRKLFQYSLFVTD